MFMARRQFASSLKLKQRLLSTLTIIEHSQGKLSPSNLNTLTAAKQLGGPINALIAGKDAKTVASEVAKFDGVEKVLVAENEAYDHVCISTLPSSALSFQFGKVTNSNCLFQSE